MIFVRFLKKKKELFTIFGFVLEIERPSSYDKGLCTQGGNRTHTPESTGF